MIGQQWQLPCSINTFFFLMKWKLLVTKTCAARSAIAGLLFKMQLPGYPVHPGLFVLAESLTLNKHAATELLICRLVLGSATWCWSQSISITDILGRAQQRTHISLWINLLESGTKFSCVWAFYIMRNYAHTYLALCSPAVTGQCCNRCPRPPHW